MNNKIKDILNKLNNEYGKTNSLKDIKSLDYDNIHFEFGDNLGIAIYKEINEFNFVIIKEINDYWSILDKTINLNVDWLESFGKVISRANNHVKLLKASNL